MVTTEKLKSTAPYAETIKVATSIVVGSDQTKLMGLFQKICPRGRTTVNQHIKELKPSGLIQGHVEGVTTKYCLNPDKVDELKQVLQQFLDNLNTQNYKCE